MNLLSTWRTLWPTRRKRQPKPPMTPQAAFYRNYYSLIANGARLKLVEAMFSLNVFALFEQKLCVSENEIIHELALHPLRAKKWLHLLSCEHFLIKVTMNQQPAYQLSDEFRQLMQQKSWWAMSFFFRSWQVAAEENLTEVLQSGPVKTTTSWPPKTNAQVEWLEHWMNQTANDPIEVLLQQFNLKKIKHLLDVGGGDGTMACAFAAAHPHLQASVYNLPKSANLARQTILSRGMSDRVHVIEGDFITEEAFPIGFDLILFSRVLFDWDESVCKKLLRMAYLALPKGGHLAVCEYYKETKHDTCLAVEYRYIFHDDFAPNVLKTKATYRQMIEEIGFHLIPTSDQTNHFHQVLLAIK